MFASPALAAQPFKHRSAAAFCSHNSRADVVCLHVGVAGCSTRAEDQEPMDLDLGCQAQDATQCNPVQSQSNLESVNKVAGKQKATQSFKSFKIGRSSCS